jgi:hypothetical protein
MGFDYVVMECYSMADGHFDAMLDHVVMSVHSVVAACHPMLTEIMRAIQALLHHYQATLMNLDK